jgi:hypothetical protein
MDHKELKEAIFDMFRKSKETPKPQYKRIDSMLGGKMNLTADDFAQLDPNSDPYKLKAAFETAYLRGNTDSRASLKTLLDTAPYNEMKDMVDLIDAAKGTANANPNRQFGASNQPTVRRSGGGLFEEKLRTQMLAGIITESEYKAKLDEAEGRDLYKTAGEMISQVGLFTQEIADELEAENRGNLYRFFNTPEEKAELIKISEAYPAYLAKVKAMMDELMSDPLYQVAVGDAKRDNALEKAYYRAKMYN